MATINDLNQSITEMCFEEAFNVIRRVRQSRLTKKLTKFTLRMAKAAEKRVPKQKKNPLDCIEKSELLKLLKESLEHGQE